MIYITLDNFFIRVHEAVKPVLRQIPFAIAENNRIIAINEIARSRGIRVGSSCENAHKQIFNIAIERPRKILSQNFSEEFFSLLSKRCIRVYPDTAWGAYIEMQKNAPSLYELEKNIEDLKKHIWKELEIPVKIGVASNKVTAKLAAEITSPGETLTIKKGKELDFIKSLPISLLPGLGTRSGSLLSGFGITTIGAFSELPTQDVVRLFGTSGLALSDTANGKNDDTQPIKEKIPLHLSQTYQLPFPSHNTPHILTLASFMTYQLTSRARNESIVPSKLFVTLHTANGIKISKQKSLKKNVCNRLEYEAGVLIKKGLAHIQAPIIKISVSMKTTNRPETSKLLGQAQKTRNVLSRVNIDQKTTSNNRFTFPLFSYGDGAQGIA